MARLLSILSVLFSTKVTFGAEAKKPKILFIAIDDLRTQVGCYGQSQMKTPHFDRLAASGIWFTRTYCQVSVCGASRLMLHRPVRWSTCLAAIVLTIVSVAFLPVAHGQRFTVLQNDGKRLEGAQIQLGDQPGDWLLDGKLLPGQSIAWIRDNQQRTADAPEEFVELHNGDRMPGRVAAYVESQGDPPHFVIVGGEKNLASRSRVIVRDIRRIVWHKSKPTDYKPATLFLKNGSEVAFRSVRFEHDSLRLLLAEGLRTVNVNEVAELHYPHRSAWDVYLHEQAILNPNGKNSLMRLETAGGLIMTGSPTRYQLLGRDKPNDRNAWRHQMQPVWSLDLISVAESQVLLKRFHQANQIPLTRLDMKRLVEEGSFTAALHHNALGDPLETDEGLGGWGIGVHAPSLLSFSLPPAARRFRTRFGLDHVAGRGGCVKARLWANSRKGKPIFESAFLVGSGRTYDTGNLDLPKAETGPRTLFLEVDAAPVKRPQGADPLNIRDFFDWVDPVVQLDSVAVRQEILRSPTFRVPAWSGWELSGNNDFSVDHFLAETTVGQSAHYRPLVQTGGKPLLLTKKVQLGGEQNWLKLALFSQTDGAASGQIEVRVEGQPIARAKIPTFDPATQGMRPVPLLVSLERFASLGKPIRLELAYTPSGANESVCWHQLGFAAGSSVDWQPLVPLEARSLAGTKLTIQSDHSILASGPNPPQETYLVTARFEQADVTAVRLEALTDPSLPIRGPGRAENGDFALTHAAAVETESIKELEKFKGRFVRIELPGDDQVLSLAEVQVFSGGRNVARKKRAKSSSALHGGTAAKAVDGYTRGIFKQGSVTHSAEETNPWWQVDLGRDFTIDRILVWNRTGTAHERLANHVVRVIDSKKKVVWETMNPEAPFPMVAYGPFVIDESPVTFSAAAASHATSQEQVGGVIRIGGLGNATWSVGSAVGRAHAAVLSFSNPVKLKGKTVTFRLVQNDVKFPKNLGRFRLSTTNQKGPIRPEEPASIVPLLEE